MSELAAGFAAGSAAVQRGIDIGRQKYQMMKEIQEQEREAALRSGLADLSYQQDAAAAGTPYLSSPVEQQPTGAAALGLGAPIQGQMSPVNEVRQPTAAQQLGVAPQAPTYDPFQGMMSRAALYEQAGRFSEAEGLRSNAMELQRQQALDEKADADRLFNMRMKEQEIGLTAERTNASVAASRASTAASEAQLAQTQREEAIADLKVNARNLWENGDVDGMNKLFADPKYGAFARDELYNELSTEIGVPRAELNQYADDVLKRVEDIGKLGDPVERIDGYNSLLAEIEDPDVTDDIKPKLEYITDENGNKFAAVTYNGKVMEGIEPVPETSIGVRRPGAKTAIDKLAQGLVGGIKQDKLGFGIQTAISKKRANEVRAIRAAEAASGLKLAEFDLKTKGEIAKVMDNAMKNIAGKLGEYNPTNPAHVNEVKRQVSMLYPEQAEAMFATKPGTMGGAKNAQGSEWSVYGLQGVTMPQGAGSGAAPQTPARRTASIPDLDRMTSIAERGMPLGAESLGRIYQAVQSDPSVYGTLSPSIREQYDAAVRANEEQYIRTPQGLVPRQ